MLASSCTLKQPRISSAEGEASPLLLRTNTNSDVNGTSMIHSAIAGYVAGSTGVIFGHPLDSAKVWLQTNSIGKNKHLSVAQSAGATKFNRQVINKLSTAAMSTMATSATTSETSSSIPRSLQAFIKTLRALYSGATGPLISVGIVQSINFATYDSVRRILHKRDCPEDSSTDYLRKDSLLNVGVAGFIAGSGLAFITSPLIMIKCQQQITGNGYREAIQKALYDQQLQKISLRRCFVGFFPHYVSEAFGRAMYYSCYEQIKRSISLYAERDVTLQERMVSAGLAGVLCWAVIFPMDTLRSHMYSQQSSCPKTTFEMARQIYSEGVFYRGFWVTVLRAGPVAAAVLPVYDLLLEKLST